MSGGRAFFIGYWYGLYLGRLGLLFKPFWRGKGWQRHWLNGFRRGLYGCWWCAR